MSELVNTVSKRGATFRDGFALRVGHQMVPADVIARAKADKDTAEWFVDLCEHGFITVFDGKVEVPEVLPLSVEAVPVEEPKGKAVEEPAVVEMADELTIAIEEPVVPERPRRGRRY